MMPVFTLGRFSSDFIPNASTERHWQACGCLIHGLLLVEFLFLPLNELIRSQNDRNTI